MSDDEDLKKQLVMVVVSSKYYDYEILITLPAEACIIVLSVLL